LVEARPGVIDTVRMREHDVLYAKVDVVSVTSKRQLAGGVWNLPNIETLQAGPILYRLEHQLGITPHGEYYLARLVEEHRPRFSILGHVWKAFGRRYKLTRLAWRELP
jgi:Icc-related predicted phosphoesterase